MKQCNILHIFCQHNSKEKASGFNRSLNVHYTGSYFFASQNDFIFIDPYKNHM